MEVSEGEGSDKISGKKYKETMPKLFSNFTPKLIYTDATMPTSALSIDTHTATTNHAIAHC